MTDNKLKLLKRYQYDRRKEDDVNEERRTWTTLVTVSALYVYDYNGNSYVVTVYWYDKYYSDMNEYYRSLDLVVHPIGVDDADNEEKVRRVAEGTAGFKMNLGNKSFLDSSLDTRSEEYFTDSIHSYVTRAIEEYLADKS